MLNKYASQVLEDLSNECLLKSLASTDEKEKKAYAAISDRIGSAIRKLKVEKALESTE